MVVHKFKAFSSPFAAESSLSNYLHSGILEEPEQKKW